MKWRGIAAVAGTMAALVGPRSIAAENIHWFSVEDSEQVSLFYGIPQSDYVEIALTCVPGGESVSFSYSSFAMPEAPDGLDLPWHRVLRASGKLALAPGTMAWEEQCRRLQAEGVVVHNGRVALAKFGLDHELDRQLWGEPGP